MNWLELGIIIFKGMKKIGKIKVFMKNSLTTVKISLNSSTIMIKMKKRKPSQSKNK